MQCSKKLIEKEHQTNKIAILTILLFSLFYSIFFPLSLQADSEFQVFRDYSQKTTLSELSEELGIPATKLKEYFHLSSDTDKHTTLHDLEISEESIEAAKEHFRRDLWRFSWNIVLVGMLVIFCSLSLTGLFIGLLSKLVFLSERKELPKKEQKSTQNRVKAGLKVKDLKSRDAGYNAAIAALTALHFHLQEAEELSKMTLSWTREPVSVWKTSGRLDSPNRIYAKLTGKQ